MLKSAGFVILMFGGLFQGSAYAGSCPDFVGAYSCDGQVSAISGPISDLIIHQDGYKIQFLTKDGDDYFLSDGIYLVGRSQIGVPAHLIGISANCKGNTLRMAGR